jgi:hypothetical protein
MECLFQNCCAHQIPGYLEQKFRRPNNVTQTAAAAVADCQPITAGSSDQ